MPLNLFRHIMVSNLNTGLRIASKGKQVQEMKNEFLAHMLDFSQNLLWGKLVVTYDLSGAP